MTIYKAIQPNELFVMHVKSNIKAVITILLFILAVSLVSCKTGPVLAQNVSSQTLAIGLIAHGGLEHWQSYGTMEYELLNVPLGTKAPLNDSHLVDLGGRRHLISSSTYIVGFDGWEGWVTPDVEALGMPPRFYALGNFYLIGQPFVWTDAGSITEDLGERKFKGMTYNVVRISYSPGTGDTPDDDYIAYFDPDTGQLRLTHFRVTHPAILGDLPIKQAPRKALVFEQWQQSGGLLVPQKITFYDWVDGDLSGNGSTFEVRNVHFNQSRPDDSHFARPSDAVVDKSHMRQ